MMKGKKTCVVGRGARGTHSGPDAMSPAFRLSSGGVSGGNADGQSANYSSEVRDELIAEEHELCKRIDTFFSAMKLLQRAVNRKEDISELKVEFETKQRAL